jgi:hypothetical protein
MDIKDIDCDGTDWIPVSQDKVHCRDVVNTVMNSRVTKKGEKFLEQLYAYWLLRKNPSLWS